MSEIQRVIKRESRRIRHYLQTFVNAPKIEIVGNTILVGELYHITFGEVDTSSPCELTEIKTTEIKMFHKNDWTHFVVSNQYSPSSEIAISWAAGEYRRIAELTDVRQ